MEVGSQVRGGRRVPESPLLVGGSESGAVGGSGRGLAAEGAGLPRVREGFLEEEVLGIHVDGSWRPVDLGGGAHILSAPPPLCV